MEALWRTAKSPLSGGNANQSIEPPEHRAHHSPTTLSARRIHLENDGYKDEIFTKRVRAGKRTYFFDVKSTKSEKDFYITITESKRVGDDEYEKHKIFLYKEDFEKFREALAETVEHVQTNLLEHQAVAVPEA
jgi:hypothetical protein